jgi:pilus assembly protein CpaB
MRRPANVFLLAVLIGALSAAMVYRYLRRQQAQLEEAQEKAKGITADVLVASETIPIGARIEARQVRLVKWPGDALPDDPIGDPSLAVGRIARATIRRNQPISRDFLASDAAGLLPLLITEGMRAMSVKVDKVTGVSGFVTPNSRVDVLVSGNVQGGSDREQRSKVILQNIKVLAIGTTIEQVDDKPVEVPTVTLLVSPEDAEKLTLAARQEPVRLALRNYQDEADVDTPGMTTRLLFGVAKDHEPVRRVRAKAPPRRPSVEVLLGETRSRQTY